MNEAYGRFSITDGKEEEGACRVAAFQGNYG